MLFATPCGISTARADDATELPAPVEVNPAAPPNSAPPWRNDPDAHMIAVEILVVEINEDRTQELSIKVGFNNQLDILTNGSSIDGADILLGSSFTPVTVPTFTGDALGRTTIGSVTRLPGLGVSLVGMDVGAAVISARLRALVNTGEARIVTRPVVLALNKTKANINVASLVPYQDVTVSGNREGLAVRFQPVGVTFQIEPAIHNLTEQIVELNIEEVKVGSVASFLTIRGVDRPVFDESSTQTRIAMRAGETHQLSSLKGRRKRVAREGIPFIMKIPFFGHLFSSREVVTENTDILFFVTAHIIPPGQNLLLPYDFLHDTDLVQHGVQWPTI